MQRKRQGITEQGITEQGITQTEPVIPTVKPENWPTPPDVVERLIKTGTISHNSEGRPVSWQGKDGVKLNLSSYKRADQLGHNEYNRISKPGDSDYDGPTGQGTCKRCAKPTQSPLIEVCYPCAICQVEAA